MNCLILNELIALKQQMSEKKNDWLALTKAMRYDDYQKKSRTLEEAGIDYRIWMTSIPRRPGATYRYPIRYDFFVQKRDYKKACRLLHVYNKWIPGDGFRGVIS